MKRGKNDNSRDQQDRLIIKVLISSIAVFTFFNFTFNQEHLKEKYVLKWYNWHIICFDQVLNWNFYSLDVASRANATRNIK